MEERFAKLPRALAERTLTTRLIAATTPFGDGGVPALLAHPDEDWDQPGAEPVPRPVVIWMHGRTATKELDPGRYLRWLRADIATCAIDLPWHGERSVPERQTSAWTLKAAEQTVVELDLIVEDLAHERFNSAFDTTRMALGGMSAGGMVTLIRLCRPHPFVCTTVEATAGNFRTMEGHPFFVEALVEKLNPIDHLDQWRPIPFLALHSEADAWVPFEAIRSFTTELRSLYARRGAGDIPVDLVSWPQTGAPQEHLGFGRVANEAKNLQADFLRTHLHA